MIKGLQIQSARRVLYCVLFFTSITTTLSSQEIRLGADFGDLVRTFQGYYLGLSYYDSLAMSEYQISGGVMTYDDPSFRYGYGVGLSYYWVNPYGRRTFFKVGPTLRYEYMRFDDKVIWRPQGEGRFTQREVIRDRQTHHIIAEDLIWGVKTKYKVDIELGLMLGIVGYYGTKQRGEWLLESWTSLFEFNEDRDRLQKGARPISKLNLRIVKRFENVFQGDENPISNQF